MQNLFYYLALLVVVAFSCTTPGPDPENQSTEVQQAVEKPVLEDYLRPSFHSHFSLSPGGKRVAYMRYWKAKKNIYYRDLSSSDRQEMRVSEEFNLSVLWYSWIDDDRIIYIRDLGDDGHRLVLADLNSKQTTELTTFTKVTIKVLDTLPHDTDRILLELNKSHPRVFDIYKLNIKSKKLTLVGKNFGNNYSHWLADNVGLVRFTIKTSGLNRTLQFRNNEYENFVDLGSLEKFEKFIPLKFTADNRNIIALSNRESDVLSLVNLSLETKKEQVVYQNTSYDLSSVIYDHNSMKVLGVCFVNWKKQCSFFEEERRKVQEFLEKTFPESVITIISASAVEENYIVKTESDTQPEKFYVYSHNPQKIELLYDSKPWIGEDFLSSTSPVNFRTSDGAIIQGLLTLPPSDIDLKGSKLPLLVKVAHDPWRKMNWGYDGDTQFLASLGYAVFEINARGTIGNGKKFFIQGLKNFTLRMKDHIDGINYLVSQGYIDDKRIGIIGRGLGGIVAMGAIREYKELFKFAIVEDVIPSLFSFLSSMPQEVLGNREFYYQLFGRPTVDREILKKESPLYSLNGILRPLLVIQDPSQHGLIKGDVEKMVRSLKGGRRDVTLFENSVSSALEDLPNVYERYRKIRAFIQMKG